MLREEVVQMWSPVCDFITLDPKKEVETKEGKNDKKDNDNKK
jgi:hypothetical protein